MKTPMIKSRAIFAIVCVFLMLSCAARQGESDIRSAMGTFCEIKVTGERTESAKRKIDSAFRELERVESLMSLYCSSSEVNLINRESFRRPVAVSCDTFNCLREAVKYSELSGGAFDVTVLPVLRAWGFFGGLLNKPSSETINEACSAVGYLSLELSERGSTVRFLKPNMAIDLGGIGKGYGCDTAVAVLQKETCLNALVNLGGNIYAFGHSSSGRPWKVGLRHPRFKDKVFYSVALNNQAVSTSGDYENYFIDEGRRYSHIIDPRTGCPVSNGVISVSVIAPTATEADALSTAVFVLGLEKGMELVESMEGVKAVIIEERDGSLWANFSRGFGEKRPIKL
ncbi:MAG: FAD:protein FMN transferase [Candidatus Omnitrophica bacterium]|nr:FAD:protein FMN transferase [Candidatus Omnitrophota bacterium]